MRTAPASSRAHSLAPYRALAWAGLRSRAAYRLALLAGVTTNSVFGLLRASLLLYAVGAAGGSVAGYGRDDMAAYVWLGQALLGVIALFPSPALAGRVRTGDIAVDLTRPVDIQAAYLAEDLGRAMYAVLPRALPTLAIGLLVTHFPLPGEPTAYLLGAVSLVLAVVLSFACRMALELLSFWFVEIRGFTTLYLVVCGFFAGLFVPLAMLPEWLQTVVHATPFPSMFQSVISVLSGHVGGGEALRLVAIQAAWAAAMLALGRVMLGAGRRKLVVQGG